jgi:hypothetical protein
MSRCDGLNVGMLLMSLIKPVEIRVTVAPVSISKFVITPFTFALIKKVEIMMIRVRQILHLSHLTKPQVLWECIN